MPALFLQILGPIGKLLLNMLIASFTGDMVKSLIVSALEMAVKKYERKAAKTPNKDDDDKAAAYREAFDILKSKWEKL